MTPPENKNRTPDEIRALARETLAQAAQARQLLESNAIIHLGATAVAALKDQIAAGDKLEDLLTQLTGSPNLPEE